MISDYDQSSVQSCAHVLNSLAEKRIQLFPVDWSGLWCSRHMSLLVSPHVLAALMRKLLACQMSSDILR